MAYLKTTATSPDDILDSISSFATSNGYTLERDTEYAGWRILSLSRAGYDHCHLAYNDTVTYEDELRIWRSKGLATTLGIHDQPDSSPWELITLADTTGPYQNLYLMHEGGTHPNLMMVLEVTAEHYRHFGFFETQKEGTWTGGGGCYGHDWDTGSYKDEVNRSSHLVMFGGNTGVTHAESLQGTGGSVRVVEADAPVVNIGGNVSEEYVALGINQNYRCVYAGLTTGPLFEAGVSLPSSYPSFSKRSTLYPIHMFCCRNGPAFSYIGYPEGIRGINVDDVVPATEMTLGADTWKIFPLNRKGTLGSGIENSEMIGVAYRKVV